MNTLPLVIGTMEFSVTLVVVSTFNTWLFIVKLLPASVVFNLKPVESSIAVVDANSIAPPSSLLLEDNVSCFPDNAVNIVPLSTLSLEPDAIEPNVKVSCFPVNWSCMLLVTPSK